METVTKEKKFLEEKELKDLKQLQEKTNQIIFELGEIELISHSLEKRRLDAKDFLEAITLEENEYTKMLNEKYGRVNIDPETGEIQESV